MQGGAAIFDLLTERRRSHWLDPRLIESWTYDTDDKGVRRLECSVGLPDGVRAEVPPPIEKRIAIGEKFLDEIRRGAQGPMMLVEVRCGGENYRHDVAVLVFKPASTGATT
jgi:hypothetical protein